MIDIRRCNIPRTPGNLEKREWITEHFELPDQGSTSLERQVDCRLYFADFLSPLVIYLASRTSIFVDCTS
jgi:hypothetical protein